MPKYCMFCDNSMTAIAPDCSEVLVCFDRDGYKGREMIVGDCESCANYKSRGRQSDD